MMYIQLNIINTEMPLAKKVIRQPGTETNITNLTMCQGIVSLGRT